MSSRGQCLTQMVGVQLEKAIFTRKSNEPQKYLYPLTHKVYIQDVNFYNFEIIKNQKQLKCPSRRDWQNKTVHPFNSAEHWRFVLCKLRFLDFFFPCNSSPIQKMMSLTKISKISVVLLKNVSTWPQSFPLRRYLIQNTRNKQKHNVLQSFLILLFEKIIHVKLLCTIFNTAQRNHASQSVKQNIEKN